MRVAATMAEFPDPAPREATEEIRAVAAAAGRGPARFQALAANPENALLNRLLESSWQQQPRPHQDRLRRLPGGDRPGSRWPPRGGIGQKSVNQSY